MKFEPVGPMLKLFGPFIEGGAGFINDIFVFFLSHNSYIVLVGELCQCIAILLCMSTFCKVSVVFS